jgi:hypothetical protein
MSNFYLVFDSLADAATAMQEIDDVQGFSDPRTQTKTWAPLWQRATDGKTVCEAPIDPGVLAKITVPYAIEEKQDDWVPAPDQVTI